MCLSAHTAGGDWCSCDDAPTGRVALPCPRPNCDGELDLAPDRDDEMECREQSCACALSADEWEALITLALARLAADGIHVGHSDYRDNPWPL